MVPIVDCYGEIPEQIFKDYIQKPDVDRMRALKFANTFDEATSQLNNEILFVFFRYRDHTLCGLLGWKTSPSSNFTAWQASSRLLPTGDSRIHNELYVAY